MRKEMNNKKIICCTAKMRFFMMVAIVSRETKNGVKADADAYNEIQCE